MHTINTEYQRSRGFTLVELLVVIAIVALLASVAYPSYGEYVVRAKRQSAQEMLYRITSQQEQFFANNKTYARTLTDLGYDDWLMAVNDEGEVTSYGSSNKTYGLAIIWPGTPTASGTTLTYTIYAFPQGAQYTRDSKCGAMWLDESGQRWSYGAAGAEKCW
jgi:type IV pilus assembly protein PilE